MRLVESSGGLMDELKKHVLRQMNQKVAIRQNGKTRQVTVREACLAKQSEVALKGSTHALRQIQLMDRDAVAALDRDRAQRRAEWTRIRRHQERALNAARASGEDMDLILPHPEDIVIDALDVRLFGPGDEAELRACRKAMRLRDLLFLQQALEDHLCGSRHQDSAAPSSPLFLALWINNHLPRRFRLSPSDEIFALSKAKGHTKRELLKICHQGWAEIGMQRPRGAKLPEIGIAISAIDITLSMLKQTREADGNHEDMRAALHEACERLATELPFGVSGPVPAAIFAQIGGLS